MAKKLVMALLVSGMLMNGFVVYASETETTEEEMQTEVINADSDIDITFDAYETAGGLLSVTESDGEDGTMVSEYGSASYIASEGEGMKISDMLTKAGVVSIEPVNEADTFEGWMEYNIIPSVDEDGFETQEYVRISEDTLYTTEEVLEKTTTGYDVMYVAKWESVPAEDYFVEVVEEMIDLTPEYSLNLYADGGMMTFEAEEPYETEFHICWLEDGKTVQDAMLGEWEDPLGAVEKEGAEFIGWTIYEGTSVEWPEEAVEEVLLLLQAEREAAARIAANARDNVFVIFIVVSP